MGGKEMIRKTALCSLAAVLLLTAASLSAGDTASFVDLGFSPDGRYFMFGQYGLETATLRPWAEIRMVDVPANDFTPDGRLSFGSTLPVAAGQDGSGALYRLVADNADLAAGYGIDYCLQAKPLYISLTAKIDDPETIEFRDFDAGAFYAATHVQKSEGEGGDLRSSFSISLERRGQDGTEETFIVGLPDFTRKGVASYRIGRVIAAPFEDTLIFVVEMKVANASGGYDIRYMIEAAAL
jgi:predicted secreted protein